MVLLKLRSIFLWHYMHQKLQLHSRIHYQDNLKAYIVAASQTLKNSSDGYTTEQVENCLKDEHSGSPKILGRVSLTSTILFLVAGQFSVVKTPPSFQY